MAERREVGKSVEWISLENQSAELLFPSLSTTHNSYHEDRLSISEKDQLVEQAKYLR